MKRVAQSELKLRQLAECGTLRFSECGGAFLEMISPLLTTGALDWQRSGAGRLLAVKRPDVVRRFLEQQFPAAGAQLESGSRIAGVGQYRDSKAIANDTCEIISLRVWRNDAVIKNSRSVDAAVPTGVHGVFSFVLGPTSEYDLRGACALVENPAVFFAAERLQLNVGLVIYGHGRVSNRVLDWLAGISDPEFRLIHLPDYDPAGLSEFQRLHSRLGERVTLHLPDDLEARFARFSNRELLAKGNNLAMLAQLRRSEMPSIETVVALIDRHNACLEHEALLLDTGEPGQHDRASASCL